MIFRFLARGSAGCRQRYSEDSFGHRRETSKKDINIHASKKFSITAKEGVELLCDTSSITLDGKAHLKAPHVNKVGLKRDPVIVPPMPELDAAEVQVVEAAVPEKRTTFVRTMDKGPIALDVAGSIPKVGTLNQHPLLEKAIERSMTTI